MLADPQVEAVIIAIADQFHVPAALKAIAAGKHVLVEKPLGTTVESCRELRDRAAAAGLVVQVGNNRRFDPGIAFARRVHRRGDGPADRAEIVVLRLGLSVHDDRQPAADPDHECEGASARGRSQGRPAALLSCSRTAATWSTRRGFWAGRSSGVRARLLERFGAYCWFIAVDFADGSLGHLDLQIPVRGDFQEGFQVYGEHGSVTGRVHLPWFHKSSDVECFSTRDRQFHRVLGEDAHTYKRQIEGFAATILDGVPQAGASLDDGLAAVQAMVAIARSVESGRVVRLADVSGGV